MATPELTIPAHDLDAAGKEFSLAVRTAWIRGVLEGTGVLPGSTDGSVAVRASKSGTDVVLRGSLDAKLVVPCARCLEPAAVQIREPLSALAVVGTAAGPGGRDDDDEGASPDDLDVLPYDGDVVVLDDLVRDELLLAVPMIPLCSETCAGIQPPPMGEPDASDGVDPRFQPLLRLKK